VNHGATVFDRAQLRRARARAARLGDPGLAEAAEARLLDRLDDVRRSFSRALALTPRRGLLPAALAGRGVGFVAEAALDVPRPGTVLADEEMLPFAPESFDLVLAPFCLHWTNDLPGALVQIRRALVPDGLFLANLPGLGTLASLREALIAAELAATGGASPRISPFVDLRDGAGLLQRAGFALPVADVDRLTLAYADPWRLLAELRAAGETNAAAARSRKFLRRGVLVEAIAALPRGADGRIGIAAELLTLTGWAPAATQQRALRPGSGAARLADALGAPEQPAGETATPAGAACGRQAAGSTRVD
jgi:SAM-dependent methyltransferase